MITVQHNHDIGMTVFRMKNLEQWQVRIVTAVRENGGMAIRKGATCHLWQPEELKPAPGAALRFVDGVRIVRQRLKHGPGALAILPRRMYFTDETGQPASRPERELLGERRIALPPPAWRINQCLEWAQKLSRWSKGFDATPIPLEAVKFPPFFGQVVKQR